MSEFGGHTGVGHTDSESAQHFNSEKKNHNFFLVLMTGFEPVSEGGAVPRLGRWSFTPTPPPKKNPPQNGDTDFELVVGFFLRPLWFAPPPVLPT